MVLFNSIVQLANSLGWSFDNVMALLVFLTSLAQITLWVTGIIFVDAVISFADWLFHRLESFLSVHYQNKK